MAFHNLVNSVDLLADKLHKLYDIAS